MKVLSILLLLLALSCSSVQAQEWALKQLDKSPRHLDWVTLKQGERQLKCFIAYPEVKAKATSVLVIHEIFGLSDWIRLVCDQLAKEGFIAIAPDLLSGKPGEDTTKYKGNDELRKAVTSLPQDQVTADLNAAREHVVHLPAANGKIAVAGFCWGGSQSFRYATNSDIKTALVFYGASPDAADLARIKAKVYGFYGENDARVTSTVEKTREEMKKANKEFAPIIYKGAGHGFMRSGEAADAEVANKTARDEAWKRSSEILRGL